jgi:hypothetical protein
VYNVIVAFTNLHPFNGDFSFGKSQKSQGANPGCRGVTDLGDVMLCQKPARQLQNGKTHCRDEADLLAWSL